MSKSVDWNGLTPDGSAEKDMCPTKTSEYRQNLKWPHWNTGAISVNDYKELAWGAYDSCPGDGTRFIAEGFLSTAKKS